MVREEVRRGRNTGEFICDVEISKWCALSESLIFQYLNTFATTESDAIHHGKNRYFIDHQISMKILVYH